MQEPGDCVGYQSINKIFATIKRPTKLGAFKNHLWLLIVLVTIACCRTTVCADASRPVHDAAAAHRSNGTDCSRLRTCADCTAAAPACSWSLVRQRCNVTTPTVLSTTTTATTLASQTTATATATATTLAPPTTAEPTGTGPRNDSTDGRPVDDDPLTVRDTRSCPAYSVSYNKKNDLRSVTHTVRVNVSNDPSGAFRAWLNRNSVACELAERSFPAEVDGNSGRFTCEVRVDEVDHAAPAETRNPSVVYFAAVAGGVPLEFDSVADHYMTVYRDGCNPGQRPEAQCVNCAWEDDDRRRYYCRWCPRINACTGLYQHCDVRAPDGNGSYVSDPAVEDVLVRCPAIRIDSVDPVYGPWAGGTTVRIAVTNQRTIAENKLLKVTVAGTRCLLPTVSADGTTVQCTISPTNSSRLDDGPVEISYVSERGDTSVPTLTLRSNQEFYFVDPEVTDVRPACGNITGGTRVTIRGNFLNAGNRLKVYIRENITCTIIKHGQNDVTCVTGAANTTGAGRVKLQFDHYLSKYVRYPLFEYTSDPTLNSGQSFVGIASGGTRLPVRGQHFSCIQNPLTFVMYNKMRHTGGCHVHNDTYMECTAPRVNRPAPRSVLRLPHGFQADFDKHIVTLNSTGYLLFPDPVYTDFDTEDGGRTVIINGQHLDRGYRLAGDLTVRLRAGSGASCNVTSVGPRRVVCRCPRASPRRAGGRATDVAHDDAITVAIGSNLAYDVQRKFTARSHSLLLTILFSGITVVSLIVTMVVAVVYCTKIALMASGQQPTEMQSLCEQLQSTATISPPVAVEPSPADTTKNNATPALLSTSPILK